jgi:hypothetical protein
MGNVRDDQDILRTPNPGCPACKLGRYHNPEEWKKFHPKAGTGIDVRTAPHK